MLPVLRVASVLMAAVILAGCSGIPPEYRLRSEASWNDGQAIFAALLSEPRFKEVADGVAPFTVSVRVEDVRYPTQFQYAYKNGNVTNSYARDAGFTLTISRDIALAVLNADDGFRVFACAMKANAATFEANNVVHAASFNGAKSRIFGSATDCTAKVGDAVTFRGLTGHLIDGTMLNNEAISSYDLPPLVARLHADNFLVFNEWRAPTRWIEADDYSCWSATAAMVNKSVDLCAGVGTSVPSSDLAVCAAKVKEAYADEPPAEGWSAGQAAARGANQAAEEALCQLVFGGV